MRYKVQSMAKETKQGATFLASFPTIQSAIKIYGDLQGMRIQLDIPESEMAEAVNILAWREQILRVTIEPETDGQRHSDNRKIHF